MDEHVAPVDPVPRECVVLGLVEAIPRQLLRQETADAAFTHDLRQLAVVPEDIGVPELETAVAELPLEEPLTVQELAQERLAGGDVAIRLDPVRVEADDNAHVLLDFGDSRFAVVTSGFTMQKYRSPAIELYGSEGTAQLLGDDGAPEGWELWRSAEGYWRVHPESDPHWQWTDGCGTSSTASRPVARRLRGPSMPITPWRSCSPRRQPAATAWRARITSDFPDPVYDAEMGSAPKTQQAHDPRSSAGS